MTARSRPRSRWSPTANVDRPANSLAPSTVVSCVVVAPNAPSSVGRNGGIQRSAVLATAFAPVMVASVDVSTPMSAAGPAGGSAAGSPPGGAVTGS